MAVGPHLLGIAGLSREQTDFLLDTAQEFVEINQRVKKGDPLCLIEVMKLFTTIPAPTDGLLKAIAVEDAAPVEFDQILFVIKPDA